MIQDIFAGILCIIVAVAGLWVWWIDNGGAVPKKRKDDKIINKEDEGDGNS